MVADIRAVTICNLGVVVQGAISDESLSPGQGLIRCRGQVVIDGLITPAAGTVVDLAYVRDDRIVRVPRKMRVLSSFADPFRNITTVQLGDKLVWLADKAPDRNTPIDTPIFPSNPQINDEYVHELSYPDPTCNGDPASIQYVFNGICWQAQNRDDTNSFRFNTSTVSAAEQNPNRPADEQLRAPVTIAASTIAAKCLAALGLCSPDLAKLQAHYVEEDAIIVDSYTETLDRLLSAEALAGFLRANETFAIEEIAVTTAEPSVFIDEEEIVDISPIGQGDLPSELFEIDLSSAIELDGIAAVPSAQVPQAFNFTISERQQGAVFNINYEQFLINARFDYFKYIYNQVTVSVTAGEGCSVTTFTSFITVTVNADHLGPAFIFFTISDGDNTSNEAFLSFNVIEDAPGEDEIRQQGSLAGFETTFTTGGIETIVINYIDAQGASRSSSFRNIPSSSREETYGVYGELLYSVENKYENAVAAAGNIFELWLAAGRSPSNHQVKQVIVVENQYEYDRSTTNERQSTECQANGLCEYSFELPSNPSAGDTLIYGQCTYVFNGTTWAPSAQVGNGTITTIAQPIPTTNEARSTVTVEPRLISTTQTLYEDIAYVGGSINWPRIDDRVPPLPVTSSTLTTEQTVTTYSTEINPRGARVTREDTVIYRARYKTIEGQQYLAQQAELLEQGANISYQNVLAYSLVVIIDEVSTSISLERVDEAGTPTRLRSVVPRTFDNLSNTYAEAVEQFREFNAQTQERKRAIADRFIRFGTRYGLGLQVVPWALPLYPLSPLYVNMRSAVGAFRANGISIAFSSDGILANCDALLVGGVGGTGVPWFPLPDGTTLLNAPEPTVDGEAVPANSIEVPEGFDPNAPGAVFSSLPADEDDSFAVSLEPEGIVLSDPVTYRIFLGVRVGMAFDKVEWSLAPQIKDQELGVQTGLTVQRITQVKPPAAAVAVAGVAPVVSGGASVQAPVADIAIAAAAPVVAGGASVAVPAAAISVAAAPGPVVPRLSTVTTVPAAGIVVAAVPPALSTGAAVVVPAANVVVTGVAPRAGGNLGDNYGLTALIEDDLQELL